MARIRTIKPEFATDEKLAKVSRDARLTFVLCLTQADDDGLIPGNHRQLLASLYPLDDSVTYAKLAAWVEELVEMGRVRWRETLDGSPILEIVSWAKHQKVDHKGKSLILPHLKPFGEEDASHSREIREEDATVSRSDLGPRTMDLRPCAPRKTAAVRVVPTDDPRFARFWSAYPRRAGGNSRGDALKVWRSRVAAGVDPEQIEAGGGRYRAYCDAEQLTGTKYVMQATRFLGAGEHYLEPWEPGSSTNGGAPKTRMEIVDGWYVDVPV